MMNRSILFPALLALAACQPNDHYDLIIRNGILYDGSGSAPVIADLAIRNDKIAAMGNLDSCEAVREIDATGLAVAPGFINILSWANESLIADGRSMSDIKQGVTLEVFGEGSSDGPLNSGMKKLRQESQGEIKYEIEWTSLKEYLDYLVRRGVSCNVASFVGATTVRVHELGYSDRTPTDQEMSRMKKLVRQAMKDGAMGLSTSLIYAPACYSRTDELVELAKVAAEYDGLYITHLRSEGDRLLEAFDEMLTIAREAGIRSEVYHLKAAGLKNWTKMAEVIARIDAARASGVEITGDMYTYTAAATGLDACMPPWVQEGGTEAWIGRLRDPEIRARLVEEISEPGDNWENFYDLAGSPDNIVLVRFTNDTLKKYSGMTLSEISEARSAGPVETLTGLLADNGRDIDAVYFLMSEENLVRQIRQPFVSFGSDAESQAAEGIFLRSGLHPRAYGNFARLIGRYVMDRETITLEEAIRRLTSLPADNLRLDRRGKLFPGHYADIVVFDPLQVEDRATFTEPQQYSTGMIHVFVNGTQVLANGEHTGEKPGVAVRRLAKARLIGSAALR